MVVAGRQKGYRKWYKDWHKESIEVGGIREPTVAEESECKCERWETRPVTSLESQTEEVGLNPVGHK